MKWYQKYLEVYEKPYTDNFHGIAAQVRANMSKLQSDTPLVTVSVIAYNEEKHLLACLWSLSEMSCRYPVEVIGVDNESKDKTADIFRDCGVPYFMETQHSCGFARLCGLNHARGKYHINIDSDTMYPPHYVESMVRMLEKKDVIAVSATWGYIPDANHSAIGLFFYEKFRNLFLRLQSIKRPELSVRGLVLAYRVDEAKKVGIRTDIVRGEDGYLAFKLKQFGKIKFLHSHRSRAITGYGTVGADGSLFQSFKVRFVNSMKRISSIFKTKQEYKDQDSNLVKKK